MNRAVATMSGIRRCLFIEIGEGEEQGVGRGAYHRLADQAIAELGAKSKSCVTPLLFSLSHYAIRCLIVLSRYAIVDL